MSLQVIVLVAAVLAVAIATNWVDTHKYPEPSHEIELVFAVRGRQTALVPNLLARVSEPSSPEYGQHLSLKEVTALFSDTNTHSRLRTTLEAFPVSVRSSGEFIRVRASVAVAEAMLPGSRFVYFRDTDSLRTTIRSREYEIPSYFSELVDFIGYSNDLPWSARSRIRSHDLSSPEGVVTPDLFNKFYNIDNNVVATPQSTQCVFESLNQSYSQRDTNSYMDAAGIPRQYIAHLIGPDHPEDCFINGGENCGEANLDVQVMQALAQEAPTTFWSVPAPGSSEFEPFLEWIISVSAMENPPLVHSISYGDVEADLDTAMMQRFSYEVQKLGLRGVSVIVSSGDDGVGNHVIREGKEFCGYNPSFPASDPFVTSIGATQGPENGLPEVACSSMAGGIITTGGGFSDVFPMPEYQRKAVEQFIATPGAYPDGVDHFNHTGRGFPDVSLLGYNYRVYVGGRAVAESGTSASAPAFAAMVTLINGKRMAAGKSPLGFLNPLLYSAPESMYNDITEGENFCGAGSPYSAICCDEGFNSVVGWDPVTGLGSVDFAEFSRVMEKL